MCEHEQKGRRKEERKKERNGKERRKTERMVVEWPNISPILLYFILVLRCSLIQTLDLVHAEAHARFSSIILSLSHSFASAKIVNY